MPRTFGRYWRLLAHYLRPEWPRTVLLGIILCGTIAVQIATPFVAGRFIDQATGGGAMGELVFLALLTMGLALAGQGMAVAETYAAEHVSWAATNALRADLLAHLLALDATFHTAHTSGELIERVDGDVATLARFFSRFAVFLLGNAVLVAGVLALLWFVDWRVGAGLSAFVVVALAAMLRIRAAATPAWAAERQATADFYGFVGDYLAGLEDVRANGAGAFVLRRCAEFMRLWLRATRKAQLLGYALVATSQGLFALGTIVAFAVSALLFRDGALTIGTVYLIFRYTEMLREPTEQIRNEVQDLQQADASIGRIEALLNTAPRLVDGTGLLPAGTLSIAFEEVSFSYNREGVRGWQGEGVASAAEHSEAQRKSGAAPVLQSNDGAPEHSPPHPLTPSLQANALNDSLSLNALEKITFSLEAGRILGIVGRTGSGKTTLTRLVARFYDPSAGAVRLGGVDVRSVRLDGLRERIGLVSQDVHLFNASVRDNLTLFDDSVPDMEIRAVLDTLGLAPWLQELPSGLDTLVGLGGVGLSAGQAQMLACARIFLRDPDVVILDEASSRLDPATERLLHTALGRLLEGRTGIIVAHRLSTVAFADDILVLEDGQVREHGPRQDLAANPDSHFAALLRIATEEVLP